MFPVGAPSSAVHKGGSERAMPGYFPGELEFQRSLKEEFIKALQGGGIRCAPLEKFRYLVRIDSHLSRGVPQTFVVSDLIGAVVKPVGVGGRHPDTQQLAKRFVVFHVYFWNDQFSHN